MCRLDPHPPLLGVWFAVAVFGCNSGKKMFTQLKLASWRNHRIHPNSRPCNSMSSHPSNIFTAPILWSHVPVSVNQFPTSTVFPVEFHQFLHFNTACPGEDANVDDLNVTCDEEHGNCLVEGGLRPDVFKWTMWGKRFHCQSEKKMQKKGGKPCVEKKMDTKLNWSPWCVLFCLFCLVWMVIMLSTQRPVIVLIYHLHIPERSSFVSSFWPWVPKQCDRLSEEREDFIMTGNRRKKGVVPSQGVEVTLFIPFLWVSSFFGQPLSAAFFCLTIEWQQRTPPLKLFWRAQPTSQG